MQSLTTPYVSVVMPAYNAEKYLREAIDSILTQTFDNFELIIINDGSTDNTEAIIQSYSDPRIVYLKNEQNAGICVTLNKGLDAAHGRYIARMDADDIAMPDRLSTQVTYMDSHPETGALGSDIEIFGEEESTHIFRQLHTPEECAAGLLFNPCFAHPSVIIRRSVLTDNKLHYKDEFRGLEDYELWWQIARHAELDNIPRPLLRYRHHRGQETQNVSQRVRDAFLRFIGIRFRDLGIRMSERDISLWHSYSCGEFHAFGAAEIKEFILLARRVIDSYPLRGKEHLKAVRLTMSKSITYIINKSPLLSDHRQRHYNKAFVAGVFSPLWFSKVTYHNLRR